MSTTRGFPHLSCALGTTLSSVRPRALSLSLPLPLPSVAFTPAPFSHSLSTRSFQSLFCPLLSVAPLLRSFQSLSLHAPFSRYSSPFLSVTPFNKRSFQSLLYPTPFSRSSPLQLSTHSLQSLQPSFQSGQPGPYSPSTLPPAPFSRYKTPLHGAPLLTHQSLTWAP